MASIAIFTVDAFTDKIFGGNAAAVCPLDKDIPDGTKQSIAMEMNISETAFINKLKETDSFENSNHFGLRWFTPTTEVPLCGHATLASAHVLFNSYGNKSDELKFDTLRGTLVARKNGNTIILDMPLNNPYVQPDKIVIQPLLRAVVGNLDVQDVKFSPTAGKLLIRIDDKYTTKDLESASPDYKLMMEQSRLAIPEARGVILTLKAKDQTQFDFYSRYFAPWMGINEDPATGSAHTVLGPYWAEQLKKKDLKACQWSTRKAILNVKVRADDRVDVSGEGQLVLKGLISY